MAIAGGRHASKRASILAGIQTHALYYRRHATWQQTYNVSRTVVMESANQR